MKWTYWLAFAGLILLVGSAKGQGKLEVVHARGGLPNVFAKLKKQQPVRIVWFGGSITEGAGASSADQTSYRGRVGHWFETTFAPTSVTNFNAAIGGTGSDLGAFRVTHGVLLKKPDLVFVEFAVNDGGTPDVMIDRAMEGIVRQIRRADPHTDICFVYTFVVSWLNDFKNGQPVRTVNLHEAIAEHYGIPSVNMAVPAANKLIDGSMTPEQFSKDGVHPTDAGYQIYADALIGFLEAQSLASAPEKRYALPRPLRNDSLEHTHMTPPDEMKPYGTGWDTSTQNTTGRFPLLLASNTPDSEQVVHFSGPILAIFYVLGPDTGSFDYRIDDGAWKTMDPFDVFAKGYYRAHYRLLEDGLTNGPHNVTFKIRAEHNKDSKGTYTRLGYLLTNPPR